jgi:hypothetical protein
MAVSESSFLLFVIIEIRTLDMVFKFKNFFDTPSPFIRVKSFFDPPIYKGKTSFAPPPSISPPSPPLPINNDHSLIVFTGVYFQI